MRIKSNKFRGIFGFVDYFCVMFGPKISQKHLKIIKNQEIIIFYLNFIFCGASPASSASGRPKEFAEIKRKAKSECCAVHVCFFCEPRGSRIVSYLAALGFPWRTEPRGPKVRKIWGNTMVFLIWQKMTNLMIN